MKSGQKWVGRSAWTRSTTATRMKMKATATTKKVRVAWWLIWTARHPGWTTRTWMPWTEPHPVDLDLLPQSVCRQGQCVLCVCVCVRVCVWTLEPEKGEKSWWKQCVERVKKKKKSCAWWGSKFVWGFGRAASKNFALVQNANYSFYVVIAGEEDGGGGEEVAVTATRDLTWGCPTRGDAEAGPDFVQTIHLAIQPLLHHFPSGFKVVEVALSWGAAARSFCVKERGKNRGEQRGFLRNWLICDKTWLIFGLFSASKLLHVCDC